MKYIGITVFVLIVGGLFELGNLQEEYPYTNYHNTGFWSVFPNAWCAEKYVQHDLSYPIECTKDGICRAGKPIETGPHYEQDWDNCLYKFP